VIWNISPLQQIGPIDVMATFRHVGTRWADNANTRLVDGYSTVDAAFGYRFRPGIRLTVRGRNLADSIYTQSISNTAGRLEPPRSVDVTLALDLRRF
jgi:iron complex outermembrane receptor protein